jgi:hypothetical protein
MYMAPAHSSNATRNQFRRRKPHSYHIHAGAEKDSNAIVEYCYSKKKPARCRFEPHSSPSPRCATTINLGPFGAVPFLSLPLHTYKMKAHHLLSSILPLASALKQTGPPPEVVSTFKWRDPFGAYAETPAGFAAACSAEAEFAARQYKLRDHMAEPPRGFSPWADALSPVFRGKPFPGSWGGWDEHGMNRQIVVMDYADVPVAVKDWIESPEGKEKSWFAVYDKPAEEGQKVNETAPPRASSEEKGENQVMIFAAGALYEILPLWLADASGCKGRFALA